MFSNTPSYSFLESDLVAVFKQQSGQDITQPMGQVLASMDASTRQAHLTCLENVFLAGEPDFRKTPRCQVQNYLLIMASAVLMASIAVKCKYFIKTLNTFLTCELQFWLPCNWVANVNRSSKTSLFSAKFLVILKAKTRSAEPLIPLRRSTTMINGN